MTDLRLLSMTEEDRRMTESSNSKTIISMQLQVSRSNKHCTKPSNKQSNRGNKSKQFTLETLGLITRKETMFELTMTAR